MCSVFSDTQTSSTSLKRLSPWKYNTNLRLFICFSLFFDILLSLFSFHFCDSFYFLFYFFLCPSMDENRKIHFLFIYFYLSTSSCRFYSFPYVKIISHVPLNSSCLFMLIYVLAVLKHKMTTVCVTMRKKLMTSLLR